MMSTGPAETVTTAIRSALGDDVQVTVQEFSSGALAITIRRGERTAMIDARSPSEWAVSVEPSESEAFTGHDHTASSLAEVVDIVRREWSPR
ncbi:hypothetical protein HW130_32265 [Streptomyces sp. PKU-EA00015]|uniref:hypothetical protein n=1 Tax=Streptomyces sp. PKU-EA00015 TaxID=2748326 RepID=UPI0015A4C2B4|nr:hypothetical protein [Streptomyces sp. PKU-EA00015]NWF30868.1 hypothetical protein [Streptomyces sp. PKU-EA00015]